MKHYSYYKSKMHKIIKQLDDLREREGWYKQEISRKSGLQAAFFRNILRNESMKLDSLIRILDTMGYEIVFRKQRGYRPKEVTRVTRQPDTE